MKYANLYVSEENLKFSLSKLKIITEVKTRQLAVLILAAVRVLVIQGRLILQVTPMRSAKK